MNHSDKKKPFGQVVKEMQDSWCYQLMLITKLLFLKIKVLVTCDGLATYEESILERNVLFACLKS